MYSSWTGHNKSYTGLDIGAGYRIPIGNKMELVPRCKNNMGSFKFLKIGIKLISDYNHLIYIRLYQGVRDSKDSVLFYWFFPPFEGKNRSCINVGKVLIFRRISHKREFFSLCTVDIGLCKVCVSFCNNYYTYITGNITHLTQTTSQHLFGKK